MTLRSKTYAYAVWDIIKEKSEEEIASFLNSLELFATAYKTESVFRQLWEDPRISLETKEKVMETTCSLIQANKLIVRFLFVLLREQGLKLLPSILAQVRKMRNEHFRLIEVTVKTASPLTRLQKAEGEQAIKKVCKKEKVQWIEKTDESLKGGILLEMEGLMIDATLKRKMKRLEETLLR